MEFNLLELSKFSKVSLLGCHLFWMEGVLKRADELRYNDRVWGIDDTPFHITNEGFIWEIVTFFWGYKDVERDKNQGFSASEV